MVLCGYHPDAMALGIISVKFKLIFSHALSGSPLVGSQLHLKTAWAARLGIGWEVNEST